MSDVLKIILKNKKLINEVDNNGNTLLLSLIYLNKINDIKELLKYNPNISHKNFNDYNALTLSKKLNYTEIYNILIEYVTLNNIQIESTLRKRTSSSNLLEEDSEYYSNSSLSSSVSSISDE